MPNNWITEDAVEQEIQRLQQSEMVKLAQLEQRIKNKRRKYMYDLRWAEKRGKELAAAGYTMTNLRDIMESAEARPIED